MSHKNIIKHIQKWDGHIHQERALLIVFTFLFCYTKKIEVYSTLLFKKHIYLKGYYEQSTLWQRQARRRSTMKLENPSLSFKVSLSSSISEITMWKSAHTHPLFIHEILYLLVWQMSTVSPDGLNICNHDATFRTCPIIFLW